MEQPTATDDGAAATRRSKLVGIKLRTLVREHLGADTVAEPVSFTPGAALVHGADAWVLLDDHPEARLGAAIAWALRVEAASLQVIAGEATGLLARRALAFDLPIGVWHAEERSLWPAVAEPHVPSAAAPAHHRRFRALIEQGGAEPVEEHGVLVGEVRGLEVCRVVDDSYTGDTRLEVGVGAHDREAFTMLHGDIPTVESLARVVGIVEQYRRVDAPPHPLNRLGAERLLRWRVVDDPTLVGASSLAAEPPPVPRRNLKDPVPCVAAGFDRDHRRVVVVCSTGVDLDLVPFAADARAAHDGVQGDRIQGDRIEGDPSQLVIVTPMRDRLPVVVEIARRLRQPATFVSLD